MQPAAVHLPFERLLHILFASSNRLPAGLSRQFTRRPAAGGGGGASVRRLRRGPGRVRPAASRLLLTAVERRRSWPSWRRRLRRPAAAAALPDSPVRVPDDRGPWRTRDAGVRRRLVASSGCRPRCRCPASPGADGFPAELHGAAAMSPVPNCHLSTVV